MEYMKESMVLNGFIESLLEHYIHGNRYTENDSSLFPENLAVAESCGRISAFLRSEVQKIRLYIYCPGTRVAFVILRPPAYAHFSMILGADI